MVEEEGGSVRTSLKAMAEEDDESPFNALFGEFWTNFDNLFLCRCLSEMCQTLQRIRSIGIFEHL